MAISSTLSCCYCWYFQVFLMTNLSVVVVVVVVVDVDEVEMMIEPKQIEQMAMKVVEE